MRSGREAQRDAVTTRAVVQARTTSTRLPGKVLADVGGEPLLSLLLQRLARAACVDEIVVATSCDASDDAIERLCREHGTRVHRGPLEDVLARYVGAIEGFNGTVVRITADCPLIDPAIVDAVVQLLHEQPGTTYASNIEPRSFPDGLDVEAFPADVLREAERDAVAPETREHVTLGLSVGEGSISAAVVHDPPLGHLRWTVDDAADLEFVRAVVHRLGASRYGAGLDEILEAVRRHPSLAEQGLRG